MNRREAHGAVTQLVSSLRNLLERDPQLMVTGKAVRVLDAVISVAQDALPNHPIVGAIRDAIPQEEVEREGSIKVADALLIAEQLQEALHEEPGPAPRPSWLRNSDG